MKTIGQLLGTLSSSDGVSIPSAQASLQKLKDLANLQLASPTVQAIRTTQFTRASRDAAVSGYNVLSIIDDIISDPDMGNDDSYRERARTIREAIESSGHSVPVHNLELECGTVLGYPVIVTLTDDDTDEWARYLSLTVAIRTEEDDLVIYGGWEDENYSGEWFTTHFGYTPVRLPNRGALINWGTILANSAATATSTDMLYSVLQRAQVDGSIKVQQVKDIIAQFGDSDASRALMEMIAGLDSLSSLSAVALIGRIIETGNADYSEGDEYYSPMEIPSYNDNVLGLVLTVLGSIIAVVLSIVFKAVGAIVSVIVDVLSSVWSMVQSNLAFTAAEVVRSSDLPVWNYPFPAVFGTGNDNLVTLRNTYRKYGEDYGTLAILRPVYGSGSQLLGHAPLVRWAFPSSDGSFCWQPLVPACVFTPTVEDIPFEYIPITKSGELEGVRITEVNPSPRCAGGFLNPADYLSFDSDALAKTMANNLYYELASMQIYHGYETYKPDIFPKVAPHSIGLSTLMEEVDAGAMFSITPWSALGISEESWKNDSVSNPHRESIDSFKLWLLYVLWRLCRTQGSPLYASRWDYNDAYSFEDLKKLMSWNPLINQLRARDVSSPLWQEDVFVSPGSWVQDPAVNFPDMSRRSLISALIITAVSAAAVAATTIAVKGVLKRKAVAKLAIRETELSQAREALAADPNNVNKQKAVSRANRRLTRSWSNASRLGVNTYNGFSTGSTPVATPQTSGYVGDPTLQRIFESITGRPLDQE